jgi:hypothetical protein
MAFTPTHGRLTVLTVATLDISLSTKTSTFSGSADVHDTTGYGTTNRTKVGGLIDGKFTASGSYDLGTVTGTGLVMEGKEGTTQAINRKVAGTGSGKPQEAFSGVLSKFDVSDPVDDIVTWAAEWEVTGVVNRTVQP